MWTVDSWGKAGESRKLRDIYSCPGDGRAGVEHVAGEQSQADWQQEGKGGAAVEDLEGCLYGSDLEKRWERTANSAFTGQKTWMGCQAENSRNFLVGWVRNEKSPRRWEPLTVSHLHRSPRSDCQGLVPGLWAATRAVYLQAWPGFVWSCVIQGLC